MFFLYKILVVLNNFKCKRQKLEKDKIGVQLKSKKRRKGKGMDINLVRGEKKNICLCVGF